MARRVVVWLRDASRRPLTTVLLGALVTAASLAIAVAANRDADNHRQAQGASERIRAASEQLNGTLWQGFAGLFARGPSGVPPLALRARFIARGMRAERPGVSQLSTRLAHVDGRWRYVEVVAENRLHDAAVEGIMLSMRDVTGRKALEAALAAGPGLSVLAPAGTGADERAAGRGHRAGGSVRVRRHRLITVRAK